MAKIKPGIRMTRTYQELADTITQATHDALEEVIIETYQEIVTGTPHWRPVAGHPSAATGAAVSKGYSTGHLANNWNVSFNEPNFNVRGVRPREHKKMFNITAEDVKAGNAAKRHIRVRDNRTARLRGAIQTIREGLAKGGGMFYIATGVPYATYLEYGSPERGMPPIGWIGRAVGKLNMSPVFQQKLNKYMAAGVTKRGKVSQTTRGPLYG